MKNEPFDWDPLVSHPHLIKEAALEAMRWIDEPFSAVDPDKMYEDPPGLPVIAYHLRVLAFDLEVLRLYREETIRGAHRRLYFFRKRAPASRKRKKAT